MVEVENVEKARVRVYVNSPFKTDFRQDIEFQLRETFGGARAEVISAADIYNRTTANARLFRRANEASQKKRYEQAITLLRQIVESDPADFPAWQELGTAYFIQKNFSEAEQAYAQALARNPAYTLALISLGRSAKAEVVSAADRYDRPVKTATIFGKATDAVKDKRYDEAITLLRQVVETDAADFQAWSELGTAYFIQKNYAEAEKAYLQAISKHPEYGMALISLGRLRIAQKNFDGAIEALAQAVKVQPTSSQANYFLGEAYLQIKKGSVAVGYLNEAIKLDPIGMADAHLRLAALYNAVGLKDKAALEYEQFLKKRPDSKDKKKLEDYIAANKK